MNKKHFFLDSLKNNKILREKFCENPEKTLKNLGLTLKKIGETSDDDEKHNK